MRIATLNADVVLKAEKFIIFVLKLAQRSFFLDKCAYYHYDPFDNFNFVNNKHRIICDFVKEDTTSIGDVIRRRSRGKSNSLEG